MVNYDQADPIHVKAYVNDLVYLPDGSNDFLSAGATPWSVNDWLKLSPTEFNIPAGEEVKVRYIAQIPKATQGGRYGVVFFEVSPPLNQLKGKTGAAINLRIGSIFLITVAGTERYSAELQDFVIGKPDAAGAFTLFCNVRNNGNILVRPHGTIKIIDADQAQIAELQINQEKTGVLPGTNRQFSVQYNQGKITPGKYFAQIVLDYGGDVLLGGQAAFDVDLPQ